MTVLQSACERAMRFSPSGHSFDLIAIGGGLAGLVAALRGAELGLRTAVLEAGEGPDYLCSSRYAAGVFHVSYHDVKLAKPDLIAAINQATGSEAVPQLVEAIAADCGRAVDWLSGQGAEFTRGGPISWHGWVLAPPRAAVAGPDWRGRGPDRLVDRLAVRLAEYGGAPIPRHPRRRAANGSRAPRRRHCTARRFSGRL